MDSILKLVYDDWRDKGGCLPNGRHPIINELLKSNTSEFLHSAQDFVQTQVEGNICLFDHSNFARYVFKHAEKVKVDQIKEDDAIYVWPLEIRTDIESVVQTHHFTINGVRVEYSIKDTISPELLHLMTLGKVKIVINYAHDPVDNMSHIFKIEQYFKDLGIHGSNIILIPGNDCLAEYRKIFPESNLRIHATMTLMCQQLARDILMFPMQNNLGYISDIVRESDLNDKIHRPKKFLCLNRTLRPHRVVLAKFALELNLLENSIFSFVNKESYDVYNLQRDLRHFTYTDLDIAEQIYNLIPYQLDTHHLTLEERLGFNTSNSNKPWFADTYIHIISETRFMFGNTPFISEKTYRPISNLQPFIMVGNYHSLRYLKEFGFKTFSPFIDESYDDETDYTIRMQKIYSEIEKLNNMPINEIHDWYYSITDILLHNQKHLMDLASMNPYQDTIDYLKNV